jgi:hypothetical protein
MQHFQRTKPPYAIWRAGCAPRAKSVVFAGCAVGCTPRAKSAVLRGRVRYGYLLYRPLGPMSFSIRRPKNEGFNASMP